MNKKLNIFCIYSTVFTLSIFMSNNVFSGLRSGSVENRDSLISGSEQKENNTSVGNSGDIESLKRQLEELKNKYEHANDTNTSGNEVDGKIKILKESSVNTNAASKRIAGFRYCTGVDGQSWHTNSECRTNFNLLARIESKIAVF